MLQTEPYSMAALQKALPCIQRSTLHCSDISAGSVFMWRNGEDVRFCFWNDTFSLQQNMGSQPAFTWPVGADPHGMIDELTQYAREHHFPLRFFAVDEQTLDFISHDDRLQPYMCGYDRRWSDYVYSFSDAITFQGKKFSGQRNHINKFKRLYGEPEIRFLTADDLPQVYAMLTEYELEHSGGGKMEKTELEQTKKLFACYADLGLYAACLSVGGEIAAVSIGEVIDETLIIHVEKALKRFQGAYPTIYSSFVRLISEHLGKKLWFVNREDDSGDTGLRTSKMQYQPVDLIHKYLVHIHSPAAQLKEIPVLHTDRLALTPIFERDKQAYLTLNTDIENNQYWGYDYREDETLAGHITEDTFYDGVQYDMQIGDSVNFAVRLQEDADMIGEGIVWNFSADARCELGCRLMPAYHGKGYGKEAFGALAQFAKNSLHLQPWARCFKQNEGSRRMILANGFHESREDETYFYFELSEE